MSAPWNYGSLPLDGQVSRPLRPLVVAGPPGLKTRMDVIMKVSFPSSTQVSRYFTAFECAEEGKIVVL
jgi:hypothetical protein